MGLESATYIADLTNTNPLAADTVAQGDDHLRLIKTVLQNTFPGSDAPRYFEQAQDDLASATTPDLWATTSNYVRITGTTTIEGFASGTSGQMRLVEFAASLTLTHNASTLNLPSGDDITTAAGDHMLVACDGTTNNTVVAYYRKDGKAVVETEVTAASLDALEEGTHTIWVPASAMQPTASNGAFVTTYRDIPVLDFNEQDHARFVIAMPKSWDKSAITFRAFCTVETGGGSSDTIYWALSARSFAGGDDINSPVFGTSENSVATWAGDDDLIVATISDPLTVLGSPGNDEILFFELERTTTGTLPTSAEATLFGIQIFYDVNAGNDE